MKRQLAKSTREQAVEEKWAPLLQDSASAQQYQQAYEELQAARTDEGTGRTTRQEPTGLDKVFIQQIGTGKRILEIGIRDGSISLELARRGNAVVGIDISHIVLERAQERTSQEPGLDIRFAHGDARALDFEDGSFDCVISQNLVEHFAEADARRHMREVWRVLERGGCYLFFVPSRVYSGYRSAGYHLRMYSLKEAMELAHSTGFEAHWVEPKLKWLGTSTVPPLLTSMGFWYEAVLDHLKAAVPRLDLRIGKYTLTPTVLIAARKTKG